MMRVHFESTPDVVESRQQRHDAAARPLASGSFPLSPIVAGAWRMAEWAGHRSSDCAGSSKPSSWVSRASITPDIYGDYAVEGLFGEALALRPALARQAAARRQVRHQTRFAAAAGAPDQKLRHFARAYRASVEGSLRALRTDRLDLLLIHRPDAIMDAAESRKRLRRSGSKGSVLHFGVSNFMPWQFELLDAAMSALGEQLVTNQIELHPLHLEPLHDGSSTGPTPGSAADDLVAACGRPG